jgi:hypothetical protein
MKFNRADEGDAFHVCADSREALHWWSVCKSEIQMLQKFIVPRKNRLQKVRVYWRAKTGLRYLIISSKSLLPKLKSIIKKPKKKLLGLYQHKISEYEFAGRVFRTSFNPSLPNKSSILEDEKFQAQKDLNDTDPNASKYYVSKFSDEFNNDLYEVDPINDLKDMMNVIIQTINAAGGSARDTPGQSRGKDGDTMYEFDNLVVSELIADFMLSDQNEWNFIQCKYYKMDYVPNKYNSLFPMKTLTTRYLNRNDNNLLKSSYEPFLTIASLTSRLNTLGKKFSELFTNNKVLLTLNSAPEANAEIYKKNFSVANFGTDKIKTEKKSSVLDYYSGRINKVSEHYDKIMLTAKKNKKMITKISSIGQEIKID